jgi:hypothetical protein
MDVKLDSITGVPNYSYLNNIGTNPVVLIIVTVVLIGYYVLFASLGVGQSSDKLSNSNNNQGLIMLEILLWGVFVVLILLNGMSYIFNVDITAGIRNLFTDTPEVDIIIDPTNYDGKDEDELPGDKLTATTVPEIKREKQVFHVPNNLYTYRDSKAICKAYGARLANYKDIENAYREGGDWCGYGWSEDQMALYPTQYEKWENLQKIKGHEHDCGRPGVNGGYIANPNVRFGVNCYGYKPEITPEESDLMQNTSIYPRTKKEIDFEKRVDYWRNKLPEILVAPFNNNNWSIY